MNIQDALKIRDRFYRTSLHTEEDVFEFTEALDYLIHETKQPQYMMNLGGYYYEQKRFDLALKYYEMAQAMGDVDASICLGYIWYYGRTGNRDYKKAFACFSTGMEAGDLQSAYKIADMYKNGYYVNKDYQKYCEIIEDLYPKVQYAQYLNDPLPEIFTRLAGIRMEQGRMGEAADLLLRAKGFLAQRIRSHPFFGDLNIMKWLEEDLARTGTEDEEFDLFTLFNVLRKPAKVYFCCSGEELELESLEEDGSCVICFEGQWYRNVDDFFSKAKLHGRLLTALYDELYDWEVQDGDH